MGKGAFNKRGEFLRGRLSISLKKSLIWSVILYGSETWTKRKEDSERLEAFEMWIWRKLNKISWTEHKSNEEILEMVQEERSLFNTIRAWQKGMIGAYTKRRFATAIDNGRKNGGDKSTR